MREQKKAVVSNLAEEMKRLCKRRNVSGLVCCVCSQEEETHDGVHRMIIYGNKQHVEEIMSDMMDMFKEIGIGQEHQKEKDNKEGNHNGMYA